MEKEQLVTISQFPVLSTTAECLADRLLAVIARQEKTALFFANTNFVVQCRFVLDELASHPCVIVNDGVGMDIAAKLTRAGRFASNLNGTDFTPYLFQRSPQPLRVFMIGAQPDVLAKAVKFVQCTLGQQVVGSCDGYGGMRNETDLIGKINASGAQVLLVAMGNPLQERWILQHQQQLDASLLMGVGALFDFWSGGKKRAPALVQRLRLEWLFRLLLEPRRLVRRYTLDIGIFLWHCIKYGK